MEFRTFYDRIDGKVLDYTERITETSPVEPNLSLSLEEIFERWKRNQPLDIVMRNGQYDIDGRLLSDTEEEEIMNQCEEVSDISEVRTTPNPLRNVDENEPSTDSSLGDNEVHSDAESSPEANEGD